MKFHSCFPVFIVRLASLPSLASPARLAAPSGWAGLHSDRSTQTLISTYLVHAYPHGSPTKCTQFSCVCGIAIGARVLCERIFPFISSPSTCTRQPCKIRVSASWSSVLLAWTCCFYRGRWKHFDIIYTAIREDVAGVECPWSAQCT